MDKKLSINISSRALVIVLQLINIKLYTESLLAEQLGIFFFILAFSYIFNAVLFVPVELFQQTRVHIEMHENNSLYKVFLLSRDVTIIYFIFVSFAVLFAYLLYEKYLQLVFLSLVLSYFIYLVQFLRNTLNNLGYGDLVSISYIIESLLKVVIFYLMMTSVTVDELNLLMSWVVSLLITFLFLILFANKIKLFSYIVTEKYKAKKLYRFSYPISIGAVLNWAQLQGYRIVLVPLGYAELVGFYATLSNIGSSAIGVVSLIYNHQFLPEIYKTKGETLWSFIAGVVLLIFALIFSFFLVGEVFIDILVGDDFSKHWWIVIYGILVDGANLIIGVLSVYITINGKTFSTIYPSIVAIVAMLFIYISFYLFDNMGVYTIGIPIIAAQCVLTIMLMRICKKIGKKKYE